MPKSGSTFLANALAQVTGYSQVQLCFGYERHEQDLYLPKVVDACRKNTITRHHTRATYHNIDILRKFNIRPIVLTRNLFDVVPSIKDHLFAEGFEKFPGFYCTERFAELSEEKQLDCIIDLVLPWYVNFYVSWFDAWQHRQLPVLWLRFEDVVKDWPSALQAALEFYGVRKSDTEIQEAVERTYQLDPKITRINVGKRKRDKVMLSEQQKQRVSKLASFYPWVDFSSVGLKADSDEVAFGA